ncbi:MAG: 4Fe-4S binding protein [Clostridia bacterium]|nr:4Fe-4S binding protein [Clostridia bacterium]
MSITKEQITSVKGRGFLLNRGTECFSGRIVTVAGLFTPDELHAIAECAEKFGNGKVIVTSRLAAEIVGIPFDKIPAAEAFMAERGLHFGGTGAKVRPITACKGTTCVYGNIDTQALAKVIYDKFYIGMRDVKLPHKFKIGVGGCPNSCMKPSLNDVGIEGCRVFSFDRELCRGCKKCAVAANCPSKAASVVDGKAIIDGSKCTKCGVCVGKCPFGAVPKEAESACRIFVGGTWGKTQRMGTRLNAVYSEEEVPAVIEKVMLWYKENGYVKERLGAAIDRLGADTLEAAIAGDDLILRKEEILAKPLLER